MEIIEISSHEEDEKLIKSKRLLKDYENRVTKIISKLKLNKKSKNFVNVEYDSLSDIATFFSNALVSLIVTFVFIAPIISFSIARGKLSLVTVSVNHLGGSPFLFTVSFILFSFSIFYIFYGLKKSYFFSKNFFNYLILKKNCSMLDIQIKKLRELRNNINKLIEENPKVINRKTRSILNLIGYHIGPSNFLFKGMIKKKKHVKKNETSQSFLNVSPKRLESQSDLLIKTLRTNKNKIGVMYRK